MNKTPAIIIAILLSVLIVLPAFGQEVTKGLTAKGVKVGINLAKLTGDDVPDNAKTKTGIVGGVFITYGFSPNIAIQPELLYSMKGAKWEATVGTTTGTVKDNLTYLQIPVLFKVLVPTTGNVKPSFFAGPAFGILLSAKEKGEVSGGGEQAAGEVDIKDAMKSTEFGLVFGGGAGFVVGKGMITLDARYDLGLSNIAKEQTDPDSLIKYTPKIKTGTISIMVGYSF